MYVKILLLTITTILNINQCFTATQLADFNKDSKFLLIKEDGQLSAWQKGRNNKDEEKCEEEEKCNSGIKIKTTGMDASAARDDLAYAYYSPGIVSYCEGNKWVLSGKFTGCLMTKWTKGDKRRVGHVSTGGGDGGQKCKLYMKGAYEDDKFFKPMAATHDATLQQLGAGVDAFGLVSSDNKFYTIFAKKIGATDEYKILKDPIENDAVKLKDV